MDTTPRPRHHLPTLVAAAGLAVAFVVARLGTNPLADPGDDFGQSMLLFPRAVADAGLLVAALGLAGAVVALRVRRWGRGRSLLALVGVAPAVLLLDHSMIMVLGYLPMIVGTALAGDPDHFGTVFSVGMALQIMTVVGVVAVLLDVGRRGRSERTGAEDLVEATRSTRRWTKIAIEAPLVYAITRLLMFVQAPGFRSEELSDEARWAGLGLALAAAGGAALTWGLVAAWGERFPRWMVGLAGRDVPISMAVVPAIVVAAMIMAASRMMAVQAVDAGPQAWSQMSHAWLLVLPHLLWPVWAVALAMAALAYGRRRTLDRRHVTPIRT